MSREIGPAAGGQAYVSNSRVLSALELLLGSAIVLGHNVFRALPNEVPILVVLGLVSVRLRNGGVSALGLRRPASWGRVVQIGLAAAVLRILLGEFVVDPLCSRLWPAAAARGSWIRAWRG